MTEPTSQMAESKIFVLPYRWQDVMGSLNIGNRSTDFKRNKPTGTILNEDVIEQRILGNGELYTCKLITKKIGNSNTLLRRLGIRFPESTTVVEYSFVNPKEQHSWQWTQNIGLEYYYGGYQENQWLSLSEKAIYIQSPSQNEETNVYKHATSKSFLVGRMKYLGLHDVFAKKGISRWNYAQQNQLKNLTQSIMNRLEQTSPLEIKLEESNHG